MTKIPIFNGKEIQMESWAHHSVDNPEHTMESYNKWVELQKKIYNTKDANLYKLITETSRILNYPLTGEEAVNITSIIDPHSAIPILEESTKYHSQNNPLNPVLLYLGAGNDLEHSSLFFPQTSIFVDYNNYYDNAEKDTGAFFGKMNYNIKTSKKEAYSRLSLEKEGLKKEFIFIKEDIRNKESIRKILLENNIESVDFLIQKKASINPEYALNYLELLSKKGLFLFSDNLVYESIPGMSQLWHGELYSKRLQDMNDPDNYPAKLFRKE